ncbi:MAG: UDP-N-acetylmuramoyl-L-alanyl-D-glutamate--2,6-diaminopimelate ligase [Actinomycetota bacterium]
MPRESLTVEQVRTAVAGAGLSVTLHGQPHADVHLVDATVDSRAVADGTLFCAVPGSRLDGHDFATDAVNEGASALLVERVLEVPVPQIVVRDARSAVGHAAAAIHGHPSDELLTIGVTGTNGKTTVVQMVAAILDHAGMNAGVVGTLHGARTTPEAPDLQRLLRTHVDDGRRATAMEVSSHALALHRVDGTAFDVVAFTNLGRDHLDLHGTQEEYFRAKSRLFDRRFSPVAVIDVDDPAGRLLADAVEARSGAEAVHVVEVTAAQRSDVAAHPDRISFQWRDRDVAVPLGGAVNVANAHLALEIAVAAGLDPDLAVDGLATLGVVPGRFELVDHPALRDRGVSAVVDYAHTPDALIGLLDGARAAVGPDARVIVAFGCGGDRDREKRPEMGAAAARADQIVITSDNPRTEDPLEIIRETAAGVPADRRSDTVTEADRRVAIGVALAAARSGDIVVVAGKGHETTQDLGDRTVDFDDRIVIADEAERLASPSWPPAHPPGDETSDHEEGPDACSPS